jgi:hypothetical protein
MLRTIFLLQCIHGKWVSDGIHRPACNQHWDLSICPLVKRFVIPIWKKLVSIVWSQEVTACFMSASVVITCQPDAASGIQRNRNHWLWIEDCLGGGPQSYSHSTVTSQKLACSIGPLICIYLDVLGSIWLAAICNRCQHEASHHFLPTVTWHVFYICQDTSPGATMEKCSNISAYYMQVWCVTSAKHVPCVHWSQDRVLDFTVLITVLSKTASHKQPNKTSHNKRPQYTLHNRLLWQSMRPKKLNVVALLTCVQLGNEYCDSKIRCLRIWDF